MNSRLRVLGGGGVTYLGMNLMIFFYFVRVLGDFLEGIWDSIGKIPHEIRSWN